VQGDVGWSILLIKKTKLKGLPFKHRNKGALARENSIMGKVLVRFLGNEQSWVSL